MIRAALFCLACATTAHADTFCASLTDQHATLALPDGTKGTCSTSLDLSGARAQNCRWPFAYRAPEATEAFNAVLQATTACLDVQPVSDQDVNHPDSYDLRTFHTDTAQIAVSIKDKGALQQTYVFLRIAAP